MTSSLYKTKARQEQVRMQKGGAGVGRNRLLYDLLIEVVVLWTADPQLCCTPHSALLY